MFGFNGKMTMLPYVPKQNKVVVMLSSMHCIKEIVEASGKPEIVLFYYETKGGVDTWITNAPSSQAVEKHAVDL